MPRLQKIEGIVLKKKNLLQEDVVVTIFTKEFGKLTSIAKGARSFSSRRSAHLQTGNLIKARISEYHDVMYIQSTDLVSAFSQVRTQEKMDILYLFLFVLDRMLPEQFAEGEIYNATISFFVNLSKTTEPPSKVLHVSLQKILMLLGYVEEQLSLSELMDLVEQNIDAKLPRRVIM